MGNVILLNSQNGNSIKRSNVPGFTNSYQKISGHENIHALMQGRYGGGFGFGGTDISQILSGATTNANYGGYNVTVPAMGGPDENIFEQQAASFPIYGN